MTQTLPRVLIAEDNPEILEVTVEFLRTEPYEIITARDGREAIEKLSETKPDLALIDVMMPEVNGFSVCSFIRKSPELRHMKVIMYSAMEMPADRHITEREGGDLFLTKPFSPQTLQSAIRDLLTKKNA